MTESSKVTTGRGERPTRVRILTANAPTGRSKKKIRRLSTNASGHEVGGLTRPGRPPVPIRSQLVPQLLNRSAERTALEDLLGDVRSGRGRALVVRGEAGVGKSALLEHALGAASDMRVLRTAGVESEMELAFAGVHLLYAPLLDGVKRLPGPQRDAPGVAFGLVEPVDWLPGGQHGSAARGEDSPHLAVRGVGGSANWIASTHRTASTELASSPVAAMSPM